MRTKTISRKPPRGDARNALLRAAHALVRRKGWAATSVDELCAEAGVTKGALFHHFASKEDLGVAAARFWTATTDPIFDAAPFASLPDPLDRIFGYLDFRADITHRPVEEFTCFAGTMMQEVFATSDALHKAAGDSILGHAARLAKDFEAAIALHPPRIPVSAASLGVYTQTVLQGGFILAKAAGSNAPLLEAISHLRRYLELIFAKGSRHEKDDLRQPARR